MLKLRELFRSTFDGNGDAAMESSADNCLLVALAHVTGKPIFRTMEEMIRRQYLQNRDAQGKSTMFLSLMDYLLSRGFRMSEEYGWIPFLRSERVYSLGLKRGYEFSPEQLAVSIWSGAIFNLLLCLASKGSHCLLRLNFSPMTGDKDLVSHMIAARFSPVLRSWELQDTFGNWTPLRPSCKNENGFVD